MARNPNWSVDEVILALDLYFDHGQLDDTDPRVIEVSALMNALPMNIGTEHDATFRNPNGIAIRLANFAHYDPDYHGVGMDGGGALAQELYWAYRDRQDECHRLAQSLRKGIETGVFPPTAPTDDETDTEDEGAIEGRLLTKMHRERERKPAPTRKRKKQMRDKEGQLRCEVCDLTEDRAKARFGELARDGVFDCHHKKPLYKLTESTVTYAKDLAVVCVICHRAIHRTKPMPDVATMRKRVLGAAS